LTIINEKLLALVQFRAMSTSFKALSVRGLLLCLLIGVSVVKGSMSAVAAGDDAVAVIEPKIRNMKIAHGFLMALAWGILVPCAIGVAILRDSLTKIGIPKGMWFKVHLALNGTAVAFTFIGFTVAVFSFIKSTVPCPHFEESHPKYGLVIFIMVIVQVCIGFIRPDLPETEAPSAPVKLEEDEESPPAENANAEKSTARRFWEYTHRLFGFTLVGLAWFQCTTGLALLPKCIGISELDLNILYGIFWGVTGGIIAIIFVLACVARIKK
jgi:hypothetical protein